MANENQKAASPTLLPQGSEQSSAPQKTCGHEAVTDDTSHLSDARYRRQSPDPLLRR